MKAWCAGLLSAALALALCACNGEQPQASASSEPAFAPSQGVEEAAFSLGYDPAASLHPITGGSQINLDLSGLVYEGLYELDNSFEPQPVLARSHTVSEDGLTWIITLSEGVTFSDGTPLSAAHVAYSLELARGSALYGGRFRDVAAVTAGEGTVTVTLTAPNGALPALLDVPVVLEQGEGAAPLGTGRYRYLQQGDALSLLVNVNHDRSGSLPFDEIALIPVSAADQRIAAFDSGEITAVTTDFSSDLALGYSGSCETWDFPTTDMIYVGFRTGGGPCQSAGVRRALSRAFDRDNMVGELLSGHGDPASLPISPCHGDYDREAASALDFDPAAAEEELAQAGYTQGEDGLLYRGSSPLAVTLLVNSDSAVKRAAAQLLAESLSSLGVTVTVNELPWDAYCSALAAGSFDLYLGEIRLTGDFDPSALLAGELNYGGYDSQAMAEQLLSWRGAEQGSRTALAAAFCRLFAQEAPFAPLCFERGSLLVRWGMVTDLTPTRGDPFHGIESWTVLRGE